MTDDETEPRSTFTRRHMVFAISEGSIMLLVMIVTAATTGQIAVALAVSHLVVTYTLFPFFWNARKPRGDSVST